MAFRISICTFFKSFFRILARAFPSSLMILAISFSFFPFLILNDVGGMNTVTSSSPTRNVGDVNDARRRAVEGDCLSSGSFWRPHSPSWPDADGVDVSEFLIIVSSSSSSSSSSTLDSSSYLAYLSIVTMILCIASSTLFENWAANVAAIPSSSWFVLAATASETASLTMA